MSPRGPLAGRHRRGYVRRAGAVALVLSAMAVGRVVTTAFPANDSLSDPFLKPGVVGESISLRYADVRAVTVKGSKCVSTPSTGMRTPGVFVVVPMVITTKDKPADVRYAAIVDSRGRTFQAMAGRSAFVPGMAQPGIPRYASAIIEVPVDAVAGARLRVALDGLDQRRDHMADIDLALTRQDADTWVRSTEAVTVPDPSDTPPRDETTGPPCEEEA